MGVRFGYHGGMRSLLPVAALLFLSCSPASDDSASDATAVTLNVKSPKAGAAYEWGDTIDLEVVVKEGGSAVSPRSVVWTVGELTERGEVSFVEASQLDEGDVEVSVDVQYGGNQYNERVTITIDDGKGGHDTGGDTGRDTGNDTGNNGGPGTYTGTMSSHIWYDGEYGKFDGDCPGTVDFSVDDGGTMAGTGWCKLDGEYDFYFNLEGTQGRGDISGFLILTDDDGNEYRTPFSGTGSDGGTHEASWDKTFNNSGDSLRIAGTFVANPV